MESKEDALSKMYLNILFLLKERKLSVSNKRSSNQGVFLEWLANMPNLVICLFIDLNQNLYFPKTENIVYQNNIKYWFDIELDII